MLGKHSSEQGDASDKNFLSGVEIRPFHQVKSHGVGGGVRVRPDGFRDGSVKFTHGPDGIRCNFTAIQGDGEDKRSDNSLLVSILPAEPAEGVGDGGASGYAIVERAPKQPGPCRNVCTKVPQVQDDLDTSADNRPNVGSEPGTRGAAC